MEVKVFRRLSPSNKRTYPSLSLIVSCPRTPVPGVCGGLLLGAVVLPPGSGALCPGAGSPTLGVAGLFPDGVYALVQFLDAGCPSLGIAELTLGALSLSPGVHAPSPGAFVLYPGADFLSPGASARFLGDDGPFPDF